MSYKIIRFYSKITDNDHKAKSRALAGHGGLTLEQAQAHCQRDDSSTINGTGRKNGGWDWFDGYTEET